MLYDRYITIEIQKHEVKKLTDRLKEKILKSTVLKREIGNYLLSSII